MITIITCLRLIPYLFVLLNAYSKGYRWLTIFCLYLVAYVIFLLVTKPDELTRGILASIAALILVRHALELPNKKKLNKE